MSCPAYVFTLEYQSGVALDSSIFTFDANLYTLTTLSSDLLKADTYPLRLSVRYEGDPDHYTKYDALDFHVVLIDPCIDDDLTISP